MKAAQKLAMKTGVVDQMAEARLGKETWERLKREHRANPENRWLYEMMAEAEWESVEQMRLAQRPWWEKLRDLWT